MFKFAQYALKPLFRVAQRRGIKRYALGDGDEVGKTDADTLRSILDYHEDNERERLPALDMEHFKFTQGLSSDYYQVTLLPAQMPICEVLLKAVHQFSKPNSAIEMWCRPAKRGMDSVLPLLRKMFTRLSGWHEVGRTNASSESAGQ